jgi:hypothetical protein
MTNLPALPDEILALLARLPVSAYGALENFLADLVDYQDDADAYAARMGSADPPPDSEATKPVVIERQDEMDSKS